MAGINADVALQVGRTALDLEPDVPGIAWYVERLDAPDRGYFLVVLGTPTATVGLARVEAVTGELQEWSRLPGTQWHLAVDAPAARERAGLGEGAQAALGWQPCAISRSPLYPFWVVTDGTRTRYVDQQGRVWGTLSTPNA